jgi:hypothetical protein
MGQQMDKAVDEFLLARQECRNFSERIAGARQDWHNALRSGQNVEATEAELFRLLELKDDQYLFVNYMGGIGGDASKLFEFCGLVDGGIPRQQKPIFDALVTEIRSRAGANSDTEMLISPFTYFAARDASGWLPAYRRARKLHEIYVSGFPAERIIDVDVHTRMLVEQMVLLDNPTDRLPDDWRAVVERWYDLLNETYGEETVREASRMVLTGAKDEEGFLAEPIRVILSPPEERVLDATEPYWAFYGTLRSNPKGYVIAVVGGNRPFARWTTTVEDGGAFVRDLEARYGVDAVAAKTQLIWTAPKDSQGHLYAPDGSRQPLRWWLENMLEDPDLLPLQSASSIALDATDLDAIRSADGQPKVVYGRIDSVIWSNGTSKPTGEEVDYFIASFVGSGSFGAQIYRHAYQQALDDQFGEDAQGLVGKLVRLDSIVRQRHPNQRNPIIPDWTMLIRSGTEFRVLEASAWPATFALPGPPGAASGAPQLAAAVTAQAQVPERTFTRICSAQRAGEIADLLAPRISRPPSLTVQTVQPPPAVPSRQPVSTTAPASAPAPSTGTPLKYEAVAQMAINAAKYQALSAACGDSSVTGVREQYVTAAVAVYPDRKADLESAFDTNLANWQARYAGGTRCRQNIYRQTTGMYQRQLEQLADAAPMADGSTNPAAAVSAPAFPTSTPPATPIADIAIQSIKAEDLECLAYWSVEPPVLLAQLSGTLAACTGVENQVLENNYAIAMAAMQRSMPAMAQMSSLISYDDLVDSNRTSISRRIAVGLDCSKEVAETHRKIAEYQYWLLRYAWEDARIQAGADRLTVLGSFDESASTGTVRPLDDNPTAVPAIAPIYLAEREAALTVCHGRSEPNLRRNAALILDAHFKDHVPGVRAGLRDYDREVAKRMAHFQRVGCYANEAMDKLYSEVTRYLAEVRY